MWFTKFGEYVNQGWKQASLVALLFSFIPLMGWVSVVVMALLTLRKGPRDGFIVLLAGSIPSFVLVAMGINTSWVLIMASGTLLTWILACVLRRQAAWGPVLSVCIIICIIIAFLVNQLIPSPHVFWHNILKQIFTEANQDASLIMEPAAKANLSQYLKNLSKMMLPIILTLQVVSALINLALARWWQSSLFNPGGFVAEIKALRVSYLVTIITLMTALAIILGVDTGWDVLPTQIAVFLFSGTVVVHSMISKQTSKAVWLWFFYGLLVLLFPYSIVLVAGFGLADTFVDFRAKYCT